MINLKKIDENNFIKAFNLKLAPGQEEFVSNPIRSLAQAYVYYKQCTPFGIYNDNTMVGYVMVIYDYDEESYNIWHLMIDEKEQGKGYGFKAIGLCLDYIKTLPFGKSNYVLLSCNYQNVRAINIYKYYGFVDTLDRDDDEIIMRLDF